MLLTPQWKLSLVRRVLVSHQKLTVHQTLQQSSTTTLPWTVHMMIPQLWMRLRINLLFVSIIITYSLLCPLPQVRETYSLLFVPPPQVRGTLFLVQIPLMSASALALVLASASMSHFVLHNIFWTSSWILTRFAWIYNWNITKNWLDFGDLGLIFKATTVENWTFYDTFLSAQYLFNQELDSYQIFMNIW